jgi:SlyX protein
MTNKESGMESRLVRLEELQALRDREVEELNRVVAQQQMEITELRRQMEILAGRYRALRTALPEGEEGEDPLPPHYLPR